MGQPAIAQGTSQWYLIARRGVVRVCQGMRLGETAAGELSFDPSCAQIEVDIAEDGGLVLSAVDDHELSAVGKRHRRERVARYGRAEIRLAHNTVQIEPDFVDATQATKTVAFDVVGPDDAVAEPANGRLTRASLHIDRFVGLLPDAWRGSSNGAPSAAPRRGTGARVEPKLGDPPPRQTSRHDLDEQAADEGLTPRRNERTGAHRRASPTTAALIGLTGIGLVLLYPALRELDPTLRDVGEARSSYPPFDVGAPPPTSPSPPRAAVAESAERDGSNAALSWPPTPPFPTIDVPAGSERQNPSAAAMADRPPGPLPEAEQIAPTVDQAATAPVAKTAAPTIDHAAARTAERVVPPTERVVAPTERAVAPTERVVGSSAKPPVSQTAPPVRNNDSAKTAGVQGRASAASEAQSSGDTNRRKIGRALLAADQALADGRLTTPTETSAYTLYKRVLAMDPGSVEAKKGLQSVRAAVINRALAQLASRQLEDARRTLKTASDVGADPVLLANLRNEVEYRQRLAGERGP
jgi:hypothetical protein